MYRRILQFTRAVTAKVDAQDERYVERYLCACEQELFFAMGVPEQRHALNVAYTAVRLAKNEEIGRAHV